MGKKTIEKYLHAIDNYVGHLVIIQFTQDGMSELKEKSNSFSGYLLCGKAEIEGRMLCEKLDIKLHVIEVQSINDAQILVHILIDANGSKTVGKEVIDYQAENIIHIAVYENHFIPCLPKSIFHQNTLKMI